MNSALRSLVMTAGQSLLGVKEEKLFINWYGKMSRFSCTSELRS